MTFLTRNFDSISPQILKFCCTNIAFSHETHCCHRHTCTCATKFLHHLGTGVACQKQRLGPKLEGAWLGEHPKIGDPYIFLQLLKRAISNLVHNLGLGLAYQKRRFVPKLAGIWARGASKKIGTPYLFLQPLKLATSNLVHNLDLRLAYQKTTFRTKIGGGLDQGSIQKNVGSLRILAVVEASNFKFGTQTGFGTSLPKNNV